MSPLPPTSQCHPSSSQARDQEDGAGERGAGGPGNHALRHSYWSGSWCWHWSLRTGPAISSIRSNIFHIITCLWNELIRHRSCFCSRFWREWGQITSAVITLKYLEKSFSLRVWIAEDLHGNASTKRVLLTKSHTFHLHNLCWFVRHVNTFQKLKYRKVNKLKL